MVNNANADRVTIAQPYCLNNLQLQMHLKVAPSTIKDAGKGLFAMNRHAEEKYIPVFMPNQFITEYRGQTINDAELFQIEIPKIHSPTICGEKED